MKNIILRIEFPPCETLDDCFYSGQEFVNRLGIGGVVFDFNGVEVYVFKHSSLFAVKDQVIEGMCNKGNI